MLRCFRRLVCAAEKLRRSFLFVASQKASSARGNRKTRATNPSAPAPETGPFRNVLFAPSACLYARVHLCVLYPAFTELF